MKSGLCSHETASPSPVYAPVSGSWATSPSSDGSSACQLNEADQNRLDSEPGEMSATTTRSVAATDDTGPATSANVTSTPVREKAAFSRILFADVDIRWCALMAPPPGKRSQARYGLLDFGF